MYRSVAIVSMLAAVSARSIQAACTTFVPPFPWASAPYASIIPENPYGLVVDGLEFISASTYVLHLLCTSTRCMYCLHPITVFPQGAVLILLGWRHGSIPCCSQPWHWCRVYARRLHHRLQLGELQRRPLLCRLGSLWYRAALADLLL